MSLTVTKCSYVLDCHLYTLQLISQIYPTLGSKPWVQIPDQTYRYILEVNSFTRVVFYSFYHTLDCKHIDRVFKHCSVGVMVLCTRQAKKLVAIIGDVWLNGVLRRSLHNYLFPVASKSENDFVWFCLLPDEISCQLPLHV